MISSIAYAFGFALFIQIFSSVSRYLGMFVCSIMSITVICIYLFTDKCFTPSSLEIDFGVWVLFVILFNNILTILTDKLNEKLKESENMKK